MMEKEEEEIFDTIFDSMTRLHFSILELYKKERDRRKENRRKEGTASKIYKMVEEIKRRKQEAIETNPQADIKQPPPVQVQQDIKEVKEEKKDEEKLV